MPELSAPITALLQGKPLPVAGVLFDMDGTLIDSIPAVESAWALWAAEYRTAHPTAALHGMTARSVVTASTLAAEHHDQAEHRLLEIEARPGQTLQSLAGARALLESLPPGRWGVVTSARRRVAVARLGATDLPRPRYLVTGDDVEHGKPDPEPFLRGRALLPGCEADSLVVCFEDTTAGATSAAEAGCLVIGVTGTESRERLASRAHVVLESLQSVHAGVVGDALSLRIG